MSPQDPSNNQGANPQPSSNKQGAKQQPRINSHAARPQGSGNQGSDAPPSVQANQGLGSKGSNAGGGKNSEVNNPNGNTQPLPDPPPSADPGPTPTIIYAGSTIQLGESSQYTIPDVGVLTPGGPAVTTNGVKYSLAPLATAIFSNGNVAPLYPIASPAATPNQTPVLTFAGSTYTANSASHFVVAGQTLTPGGSINPSGTLVQLSPDGAIAVIGSSSFKQTLGTPATQTHTPQLTLGGTTYTADPFGGAIIVSNTLISLAADDTVAVIGTSIQLLTPSPSITQEPVLTFAGTTYTVKRSSAFNIDGQTLTPGGAITVNGTPLSFDASGTDVVIGTSTQALGIATITGPEAAVITVGGQTYTEKAAGAFVIGGADGDEG